MFIATAGKRLREYLQKRTQKEFALDQLRDKILYRKIEGSPPSFNVAGVDGGIGVVKLANGHQVVLARAAAVGSDFIEREFIADIASVDSASLPWAYLVIVESLVGMRALEKHGVDVLLMDGSLYAKAVRLVHNLILTREFQNLYYVPELATALYTLSRLIKTARERGARLVFVSKDHNYKLLKEHVIFEILGERYRDHLFQRGLLWYSVLWIRKFRKELLELYKTIRNYDYEGARLLTLLITPSITDIEILAEILPSGHYTVPMLVGGCDAYMNFKGLTTVERLVKAAEDRLEDSLIFRLKDNFNSNILEYIRDALDTFPKIYFFYIKFDRDESSLLVEIPVEGTRMFDGSPVKAFYPPARVDDVVSLLREQFRDPVHYNTWLWYAHSVASFKSSQLSEYAVYLKNMVEDVGIARRIKLAWGL
ncbi:DNA double-strand break repair nuclease NurA [Pyrobaculum aerophilum]|uniref:DNA double-strand break repair nuclease NurA n=1 Tax=Pyrobaculum aerophilum TaxID=13773 RepID=UPI0023F59397|nr:DNA double-strand break repair nuclease NurA [Pyrobaculum aerophilum]MCX8136085.1 DNA double-strand break repair nuclease NurA [Pyrobaculum aerophilum]